MSQRDSALENLEQMRERLHTAELEHRSAEVRHQAALAEATRQADELSGEVESQRRTVGVLTSEGAELSTSLSATETALEREQGMRRSVDGRLAAVTESRATLEGELTEIKGRLGYRIGPLPAAPLPAQLASARRALGDPSPG